MNQYSFYSHTSIHQKVCHCSNPGDWKSNQKKFHLKFRPFLSNRWICVNVAKNWVCMCQVLSQSASQESNEIRIFDSSPIIGTTRSVRYVICYQEYWAQSTHFTLSNNHTAEKITEEKFAASEEAITSGAHNLKFNGKNERVKNECTI